MLSVVYREALYYFCILKNVQLFESIVSGLSLYVPGVGGQLKVGGGQVLPAGLAVVYVVGEEGGVLGHFDVLGHLWVEQWSLAILEEHCCQPLLQT